MNIEILKKFCETDYLEWAKEPFSQNGYTFATDGRVILRVAKLPGMVERMIKMVKDLPWSMLQKRSKFRLRPGTFNAVREHFLCAECSPDAMPEKPCPKCDGREIDEDYPLCGGVRLKKEDGRQWNTKECLHCDGTRWAAKIVWCLRHHEDVDKRCHLKPSILQKMLDHLGVIEFVEPEGLGPVGFRFALGDGLLMPVRPAEWHVAANMVEGKNDNGDM